MPETTGLDEAYTRLRTAKKSKDPDDLRDAMALVAEERRLQREAEVATGSRQGFVRVVNDVDEKE